MALHLGECLFDILLVLHSAAVSSSCSQFLQSETSSEEERRFCINEYRYNTVNHIDQLDMLYDA